MSPWASSTPVACLIADEVLAKHDENYMPPEVTQALEQSGMTQHDAPKRLKAGSEQEYTQ